MSDVLPADTAVPRPWLAIVGIGEDGVDGLSLSAKELVQQAEHVFGGTRHLALAKSLIHGVVHAWPNPFSIKDVLALRGRRVCVLASGDCGFVPSLMINIEATCEWPNDWSDQ